MLWSDELEKAAMDHVEDIGPLGMISGRGTDGSLPIIRIGRYGRIDSAWAESSQYGAQTTMDVIERLIVCDGQPKRGFRASLFNPDLHLCGVATGPHATHYSIVQIDYVNKFLKDGEMMSVSISNKDKMTSEVRN